MTDLSAPHASTHVDWSAAQDMIARVVRDVAKGRNSWGPTFGEDDLCQEGAIALLKASRTFDPDRNVPFPIYARKSIAYAVKQYLREADPLPERTRRDLRKIRVAEERFLQRGISEPSIDALSRECSLTPARVLRVLREAYEASPHSAEATHTNAEDVALPWGEDADWRITLWESREALHTAINSLTVRQRQVFELRIVEKRATKDVAEMLQVTPGRVSQLTNEVLHALRAALAQ